MEKAKDCDWQLTLNISTSSMQVNIQNNNTILETRIKYIRE